MKTGNFDGDFWDFCLTKNSLDAIHFIWEDANTRRWQFGYEQAKAYYEQFGHLNPPVSYTSPEGFNLYNWLVRQRKIDQPKERWAALEAIGYDFNPPDSFETHLVLCRDYYREHGDLNPPADYKVESVWLARWINEQRRIYRGKVKNKRFTEKQVKQLEAVGMDWRTASERAWDNQYQEVKTYLKLTGQMEIPNDIATSEGKRMRLWLGRQKKAAMEGKLNDTQRARLQTIGCLKIENNHLNRHLNLQQNWIN